MAWVLISASFSTFTYTSATMPIPASPLSLHPFVSSAFFVHRTHPMSKGLLSLFIYFFSYQFLSASLHSLFVPFFPLVIAACTLFLPWLLPAKKKMSVVL